MEEDVMKKKTFGQIFWIRFRATESVHGLTW